MSEERIDRLMKDLENEFDLVMNERKIIESSIDDKLEKIRVKLETKCKKSWDWIEENVNTEKTSEGIYYDYKDDSQKLQAEEYVKEYNDCYSQNSFGISEIQDNYKNKITNSNLLLESCIKNEMTNKFFVSNDDEVKDSLRTCFYSFSDQSKNNDLDFSHKLDEVLNKMDNI